MMIKRFFLSAINLSSRTELSSFSNLPLIYATCDVELQNIIIIRLIVLKLLIPKIKRLVLSCCQKNVLWHYFKNTILNASDKATELFPDTMLASKRASIKSCDRCRGEPCSWDIGARCPDSRWCNRGWDSNRPSSRWGAVSRTGSRSTVLDWLSFPSWHSCYSGYKLSLSSGHQSLTRLRSLPLLKSN